MSNDAQAKTVSAAPNICASGVVVEVEVLYNTSGRPWVTFTLDTLGGPVVGVCFPKTYAQLSSPQLPLGQELRMVGRINVSAAPEVLVMDFVDREL